VVRLTSRPLYRQGKSQWYPLDGRLGGPQSRSGHDGEEMELSKSKGTSRPGNLPLLLDSNWRPPDIGAVVIST
jgi:hypothetical protein